MKTTVSQKTADSKSHSSKPFFNKNSTGSCFSQSTEVEMPFFNSSAIQPKLTIGQTGDKYEEEADSVADKVVQKLETNNNASSINVAKESNGHPISGINNKVDASYNGNKSFKASQIDLQKSEKENEELSQIEEDSKKEIQEPFAASSLPSPNGSPDTDQNYRGIQLKEDQNLTNTPSRIEGKLNSSASHGAPLGESTLNSMEAAFGTDLSDVRLHTGSYAMQMSQELGAQAFTHGQNIYFNEGKYKPETKAGQHLLAHELTHTIQQRGSLQKKEIPPVRAISKTAGKAIQALPAVTGINVPTEIGVGRNIRASAILAAGTPRRTDLTWSLVGAPAGVTAPTTGRRIRILANASSLASAGTTFQVQCNLTATPGDTFTSPNITLVGVTGITFTAAPALANQMAFGAVAQVSPPNTAEPNRQGVAGNTATVNIVTTPVGRPTTVTLRRRQGATIAGTTITPGARTGTAQVRVTDNATRTRFDQNLVINPVPRRLRSFTAQAASPSGTYGALNSIAWTVTDPSGPTNRVVGETITAGARDDFGFTPLVNGGPNPAPNNVLAAPENAWNDNLFTGSGAVAGIAGDANMINVNRYVGPGVAARLPRIWILRQGFHWLSWAGTWSNEFDHGTHRRSLRRDRSQASGFGFRTEHRFPRAKAPRWNENYVGPPLINLNNIAVTPAAPIADGGLAADGVATANVTVGTNVPGRLINWSLLRGTPAFTAGALGGPVGGAATLQASATPGRFRIRAADTVFPNRRVDGNFRLRPVRLRRLRAAVRSVPTGTLTTTVNLTADPGGRNINWAVDAAAAVAGVTVVPIVNPLNLAARSATVTRPAAFTGRVTVTATDSVLVGSTASTRFRFR